MLKNSSPFVLQLNTVILYVLAAGIAGVLLFFYIRGRLQIRSMKNGDDACSSGHLSRSAKQTRWRILCERFPGLSDMITWLDGQLLMRKKTDGLKILLNQEWCCKDRTATGKAPVRCRPSQLTLTEQGQASVVFDRFSFSEGQFLTDEDARLLGWVLLEEVRRLVPFRSYRMKTLWTTRRYQVENGVTPVWKDSLARMENYEITVSRH